MDNLQAQIHLSADSIIPLEPHKELTKPPHLFTKTTPSNKPSWLPSHLLAPAVKTPGRNVRAASISRPVMRFTDQLPRKLTEPSDMCLTDTNFSPRTHREPSRHDEGNPCTPADKPLGWNWQAKTPPRTWPSQRESPPLAQAVKILGRNWRAASISRPVMRLSDQLPRKLTEPSDMCLTDTNFSPRTRQETSRRDEGNPWAPANKPPGRNRRAKTLPRASRRDERATC